MNELSFNVFMPAKYKLLKVLVKFYLLQDSNRSHTFSIPNLNLYFINFLFPSLPKLNEKNLYECVYQQRQNSDIVHVFQ